MALRVLARFIGLLESMTSLPLISGEEDVTSEVRILHWPRDGIAEEDGGGAVRQEKHYRSLSNAAPSNLLRCSPVTR